MPAPEPASLSGVSSVVDGGAVAIGAGWAIRELWGYFRSHGKEQAEAEKLTVEAQAVFNAMVDARVKMILEADQEIIASNRELIKSNLETINLLRRRVDWQTRCIDILRAALIEAGIPLPPLPPHEEPPIDA